MKKHLPLYFEKCCFLGGILILCLMGRDLTGPAAAGAVGIGLYCLEYRFRIAEALCRQLRGGRVFTFLLPLFFGALAMIFHHEERVLSVFLPLAFLICQWCSEWEECTYDGLLTGILLRTCLFMTLSFRVTYHAAAPLSIACIGLVLLLRILVHRSENDWDFWKGVWGIAAMILLIGAGCPKLLERLLYIAVTQEVYDFTLSPMDLAALIPVAVIVVSGFRLCFYGVPRHTSALATGAYILLLLRFLSYYLKEFSVIMGFGGFPFFAADITDAILAVLLLQPLRPKSLHELQDDPDFEAQEVAALILLPDDRGGAEELAAYVLDHTGNALAREVLRRHFIRYFSPEERRALFESKEDTQCITQKI